MRTQGVALSIALLAGCTAPPDEIAQKVAAALEARDPAAALAFVHASYADPRGDRRTLAADLEDMRERFSRVRIDFEEVSAIEGASAKEATVVGRLDAELVGEPTWRVVGPLRVDFIREDGFHVVSGLLTDVRDVRALMAARRAALEANDAEAIRPLLHPGYRDGDMIADEVIARLTEDLAGAPIRMAVTNYRLEVRGPVAHLDEHYVLTVAGRTLPPAIARFTLAPSAGRWKIRAGLYAGSGAAER